MRCWQNFSAVICQSGPDVNMTKDQPRHVFIAWKILGQTSTTVIEVCNSLAELDHDVTLIIRSKTRSANIDANFSVLAIEDAFPGSAALSHIMFLISAFGIIFKRKYDFLNAMYSPGVSLLLIANSFKSSQSVLHITTAALLPGLKGMFKNLVCRFESLFFGHITILDLGIAPNIFFGKRARRRLHEFPLGVNPDHFANVSSAVTDKLRKQIGHLYPIIYLGKMDRTRRLHKLLQAFALVKQNFDPAVLLMVGTDNDVERLERETVRLDIQDSVIFTGMVPYDSVPGYLSVARIALSYIPITRIYDNQPPLKTLEYLQVGLPQVATGTAANRRILIDGDNAIITSDMPAEYARGIMSLIENQQLYGRIQRLCQQGIEPFYWNNLVSRVLLPIYANSTD